MSDRRVFRLCGAFLLLGFLATAHGQEAPASADPFPVGARRQFQGTLNNRIRIAATLSRDAEGVSGVYLYERYGKEIALKGLVEKDGSLALEESDGQGQKTGEWALFGKPGLGLEGTWSNPDRSKSFPVILHELPDLQGAWSAQVGDLGFDLDLTQVGARLSGYHSCIKDDASRIDAQLPTDGAPSIHGQLKGQEITLTFRTGYGYSENSKDMEGQATLSLTESNGLQWKITRWPKAECIFPPEALLTLR